MTHSPYPIEIAFWAKNSVQRVRVTLDIYKGTPTFAVWPYHSSQPGEWKPNKSGGISMSASHLPVLLDALTRAEHRARSEGLLG